ETTLRITPCSHLRPTFAGWTPGPSRNSSAGKSMSCTSTVPGLMYATPLFDAITFPSRVTPCRGAGAPSTVPTEGHRVEPDGSHGPGCRSLRKRPYDGRKRVGEQD